MEKNYVYKVRANGIVYDNLASAVEDCVKSLQDYIVHCRISKPIVVKVDGGYQVIITDIHGNIYKRGIDVFVPKHLVDKVNYYIDELREINVCSCEEEEEDYEEEDYEEEEDQSTRCCEQCDKECKLIDIVNIDGFGMCKDCAMKYIEDSY